MHITKSAYRRLAASASVFNRGSGVARLTPLMAERRSAMAREAHVFDRGSGVARHTPLIAERRAAMAREAYVFDRESGGALWKLFKSKTTYGNCAALHSTTRKVAVLSLHVAFKSTYNLTEISPKRNR